MMKILVNGSLIYFNPQLTELNQDFVYYNAVMYNTFHFHQCQDIKGQLVGEDTLVTISIRTKFHLSCFFVQESVFVSQHLPRSSFFLLLQCLQEGSSLQSFAHSSLDLTLVFSFKIFAFPLQSTVPGENSQRLLSK